VCVCVCVCGWSGAVWEHVDWAAVCQFLPVKAAEYTEGRRWYTSPRITRPGNVQVKYVVCVPQTMMSGWWQWTGGVFQMTMDSWRVSHKWQHSLVSQTTMDGGVSWTVMDSCVSQLMTNSCLTGDGQVWQTTTDSGVSQTTTDSCVSITRMDCCVWRMMIHSFGSQMTDRTDRWRQGWTVVSYSRRQTALSYRHWQTFVSHRKQWIVVFHRWQTDLTYDDWQ